MSFAKDFIWGAATASYQIEGGAFEDGKGQNIWDDICHNTDRIADGHTGDVACDHYHKFREDVAIMKSLGIKHYRFSISWARLIPDGTGKINGAGAKFYTELVDELLKAGITPWVTLFHWDYPLELQKRGGWYNPESQRWFEDYCAEVVKLFGEKVTRYMLINEPITPFCRAVDYKTDCTEQDKFRIAHNIIAACARAEKRIRQVSKKPLSVGFSQAYTPCLPVNDGSVQSAQEDTFACKRNFHSVNFWSDPLIFGRYSPEFEDWIKEVGFVPPAEDMRIMKSRIDFVGLNVYYGRPQSGAPSAQTPKTHMDWTVTPESIYYGAKYIYDRYGLPMIFTENGVALTEWKTEEGEVPDDMRIDYLKRYIKQLARAAKEVPVSGYFYWSLLDNFEWFLGYTRRFGLVYVDYDTLERTPKKSAYFYGKVCRTNGENVLNNK